MTCRGHDGQELRSKALPEKGNEWTESEVLEEQGENQRQKCQEPGDVTPINSTVTII